jgi:hypothetical protein
MLLLPSKNYTYLILFFFMTILSSFSKDNIEDNDSNKLNEIPCKYTVEYSNSDSNFHTTLYIEYYSPIKKENLRDTVNGKGYWESPNISFNSNDSIYFKVVSKTPSFNHVVSTSTHQKFEPVDEKTIALSHIDYKTNSSKNVLISGKRTILTEIKTLAGRVKFSEK